MTEEIKQVEETTTEEVAAETVVEAEENVEQLPAKRQRGRHHKYCYENKSFKHFQPPL